MIKVAGLRALWLAAVVLVATAAGAQALEDKMRSSRSHPLLGYSGDLPPCGDGKVWKRITWHFYERERMYWESPLVIAAIENTQEVAFRPWGGEYIPRRFCQADVWTSDGAKRKMWYAIGEGLGEASIGWGVEWCVTGLDRNLAFAPACKMARP